MMFKVIIFNVLFNGLAFGLQCYECGFGVELDLNTFPQVFGQNQFDFALYQQRINLDKNCGLKRAGDNSSWIACGGNCVFVRSLDNLSRMAGCANVNEPTIDTMFSTIRMNLTEYEMFVCNKDRCNESAETARQVINASKSKSTSSASSASLSFFMFPLITFLIFYSL